MNNLSVIHARIQRGTGVQIRHEKFTKYRVSLQDWSGSPEKSQKYLPAFNVGSLSVCQRNAILITGGLIKTCL